MAGGVFFLLNRSDGTAVTIIISSPTAISSLQGEATSPVATDSRVDINTASHEELITLPGIGEVKAQAIVAYREQEGPFRRTDELMNVSGIGAITYERLRDLVTVGSEP